MCLFALAHPMIPASAAEAAAAETVPAGVVTQYANPLDVPLGDPYVLLHDGTYYLYATSSWYGFKVWSSPDLVDWQYRGMAFAATSSSWGKANFWAPEVKEKNGTFFMHYTSQGADGILRICVATSASPLGPFTDVVAPMFDTGDGKAWIDGDVFFDTDGTAYLYCVKDVSRNPKSQIHVARLKSSLTALDTSLAFCIEPNGGWEGDSWNEGPFVLKHNGTYYLMYSGNGYFSPNYAIGYATATSPFGPWTKYAGNPILKKTSFVSGPGHNSVVRSPDDSEMFIVYHTHISLSGGSERQLAIDRLVFSPGGGGGPDLLIVPNGPSVTPQPWPSGAPYFAVGSSDDFSAGALDRTRWLVYNEDPAWWHLSSGQLVINTQDGDIWEGRGDAKNVFLQYAPAGDFDISTKLTFIPSANYEQVFLIVWKDQNNFLRFSSLYAGGQKFEVVRELNGANAGVVQVDNTLGAQTYLKIEKRASTYRFHRSANGSDWSEVGSGYNADFSEIKAGVGAIAPISGKSRMARFDFFTLAGSTPTSGASEKVWGRFR